MAYGGSNDAAADLTVLRSSNVSYTCNVLNDGGGAGLVVNSQTGRTAFFRQNDTTATSDAVYVEKHGTGGNGISVVSSGARAGISVASANSSTGAVVDAYQDVAGAVYRATAFDSTNVQPLFQGKHHGVGPGLQVALTLGTSAAPLIDASTAGTGRGAKITISNRANPSAGVASTTVGTGRAVYGEINNTASSTPAIEADTNGTGPALYGATTGHGEAILGDGRSNGRGAVLISNVELMGRYSKLDIATKLQTILADSGRDDLPARTTRSVRRLRRLSETEVAELVILRQDGDQMDEIRGAFTT